MDHEDFIHGQYESEPSSHVRAIRGKRKDQNDRGELDEDEIKKWMENFSVDPTALLNRGCTSREAASGRKRDIFRACREVMGALGMSVWTLLLLLYQCLRGRCQW